MEKIKLTRCLFTIPAQVNKHNTVNTLLDSGSQAYAVISRGAVERCKLPRISLPVPMGMASAFDGKSGQIREVARIDSLDIGGSKQKQEAAYAYIVPRLEGKEEMILGRPWFFYEDALIDPVKDELCIRRTGTRVSNQRVKEAIQQQNILEVSAVSFSRLAKRNQPEELKVFAVSMADIEKALSRKERTDPRTKLPEEYHEFLDVFDRERSDELPPLRHGVDHRIEIETGPDGRPKELPWGPLYGMSREMLLVLRKTLSELLSKGFIRVSSSPAAAPILFARKPGGGLRFCVDYRALNAVTKKDRYPLPLIKETLTQVAQARWYTKLDIIAAFNKIRMAEGHESLTAFRTRYGLFEWLVMPFGLANAPSSFQRYVNWTLRDLLDRFVSAYVDDILIYSSGSRRDHVEKVKTVLKRLRTAGLQVDIDKCDFSVQTTKYLGFILEAGKGISMDPEKVKAIRDWEVPTSVKGVRGFIGFANFYRSFIQDFAELAKPLTDLTKKEAQQGLFKMSEGGKKAFEFLKQAFLVAPMLAQFDEDRETVVECDASGWALGGALMQYVDGVLRPIAFYSRRMTPAECNYEIYDKEMLAVIACLDEWREWLRPMTSFVVRTDHKNLEYYKRPQKLSERQIRWMQELSQFKYKLEYKPGRLNVVADALSRRDQDLPKDQKDDRIQGRFA
jgi:Reverse transcriptase (RNA-dependent DNA polymerase)/RNase H-like domain found in reverse transcriptase